MTKKKLLESPFFFFIQNSPQNRVWMSKTTGFNRKCQFQSYLLKISSWKVKIMWLDYSRHTVACTEQCRNTSSGVWLIRDLASYRILCIYQPTIYQLQDKALRGINTGFKLSKGHLVYESTDTNFTVLQFPTVMVC